MAPVSTRSVFDVPLACLDYASTVELVLARLAQPEAGALTLDAANTMTLTETCLDRRMREAIQSYDIVLPDATPLVWVMNRKGAALRDRVYGPYVTERILAAAPVGTRVALIGGYPDVHAKLVELSKAGTPAVEYVLLYDAPGGPINQAYVDTCLEKLEQAKAELVFVCLGVPRQQYWVSLARPRLRAKVCLSVGGAFDLIVGEVPYASPWMQRRGLTWLHRLAKEPRRLGWRYLKYNSLFLWFLFTRELLHPRPSPRSKGKSA